MQLWKTTLPLLSALALSAGCIGGDDTGPGSGGTPTGTDGGGSGMTAMTTLTTAGTADDTAGTADGSGTIGPETDGTSSGSTGIDPEAFIFEETPPADYTQVDRVGFPAVNLGLNLLGDQDAHNASNPAADITDSAARDNATESIITLHEGVPGMQTPNNTGLDDDLEGAGFVPCPITLGGADCVDQSGPLTLPDVLGLTAGSTGGFPDGRGLQTPVMDIILAVLLLDLIGNPAPHQNTDFLDIDGNGLSLNPIANDGEFPTEWPYLAPAWK